MFSSFPSTNRQHEIFLKEPYVKPLIKEDINLLSDLIYGQYYKDISLLRLGVLYMNYCSKHHVEFFHSIMKERLGNSNLVTKINDIDNLKINFFDFLEDSVKKSYQYVYLKLIIDRLRFSIENVSEDVENSYAKHINLLIEAENLQKPKLITAILKLIYNLIKNDQEKIQNYIEHCKKLEKINFGDWIQVSFGCVLARLGRFRWVSVLLGRRTDPALSAQV